MRPALWAFTDRQTLMLVRGPAGVPPGAGADDQRLRRAAEGQLARFGDYRRRADQADVDLRGQHRQLGRAGRAVRGAVSGAVAAAGAGWRGASKSDGSRNPRCAQRRRHAAAADWWCTTCRLRRGRRAARAHGGIRIGQDDRAAGDCRPRSARRRGHRRRRRHARGGTVAARVRFEGRSTAPSASCSSSITCLRT